MYEQPDQNGGGGSCRYQRRLPAPDEPFLPEQFARKGARQNRARFRRAPIDRASATERVARLPPARTRRTPLHVSEIPKLDRDRAFRHSTPAESWRSACPLLGTSCFSLIIVATPYATGAHVVLHKHETTATSARIQNIPAPRRSGHIPAPRICASGPLPAAWAEAS